MATNEFPRFDATVEAQTRNLFDTFDEKGKRRFAAIQAKQLGHGGMKYISELLGISVSTIGRGMDELERLPVDLAEGRTRRPGAGRKKSNA
jgi:hypothetical protein